MRRAGARTPTGLRTRARFVAAGFLIVVSLMTGSPGAGPRPASAIIGGGPFTGELAGAVGVIASVDPETAIGPDGREVILYRLCSAVLIHELWAVTEASCILDDSALPRHATGDLAYEDLAYTRGYTEDGDRVPDRNLYASFGPSDVRGATLGLIAHVAIDGPDIPFYSIHYPGYFARAGTPVINPDVRPVSFAEGVVSDYLGSLALVPLITPETETPVAIASDSSWPARFSPAILAGYGTLTAPGAGTEFDEGIGIRRGIWTRLRSVQEAPRDGDPTTFCESTQHVVGESICSRPRGADGGAICFGDAGAAVISFRDVQPLLVAMGRGPRSYPAVLCGEAGQVDRTTAIAPAAAWIAEVTGVVPTSSDHTCGNAGAGTFYLPPAGGFEVPCWGPGGPHPFVDVDLKPDPYFADEAIGFLFSNGITTGATPTTYRPDDPVTRGDLATLLYRFVEAETSGGDPWPLHPFSDVARDYQQDPVSWLFATGLTTGSPAGSTTFKAEDGLTRAEMVTFLWRLIGSPDVPIEARFVDVVTKGDSYFAAYAIAWAYETGITTGSPAGSRTFRPDQLVTRAEVATFLARFAAQL